MTAAVLECASPLTQPGMKPWNSAPAASVTKRLANEWVKWLSQRTGLPWFGWSEETGELLARSNDPVPAYWPYCNGASAPQPSRPQFVEPEAGLWCCQFKPAGPPYSFVLTTYALSQSGSYPSELVLAAVDQQWNNDSELDLAAVPVCSPHVFERLVEGAVAQREAVGRIGQLDAEVHALVEQEHTCRQRMDLLHGVTQQLRLSTSPVELAQFCLQRLQGLIDSAGHFIALQDASGETHNLMAGLGLFNHWDYTRLLDEFDDHDWSRPLVRNRLRQSSLGVSYPGLQNFAAVAIADGEYRRGWIVSANLRHDDFGPDQADVLHSVARMLATHVRNIELYGAREDLMICFVRSLVSTLDAKDPYTRGHSERVALVARQLGQQLGLTEAELDDIYLAGLLHDLGKISVDDRILQKPGPLTDDEFQHIQKHPVLGFQILQQLGNLQHILPGVRNHHEAWNGRGYPDRLRGEEIPLMARIMCVADSFDAMASNRPYRPGMPLERLEDIFRRGAGQQWDPRVIDAYFAARDEIVRLCRDYDPEQGDLLQNRGKPSQAAVVSRMRLRD